MSTETEISAACLAALRLQYPPPRAWWYRNNTGVARIRGSHVRYGLGNGSPDIVGCVDGIFCGVEVKKPKRWQDTDQVGWQTQHELAGGVYVLAHSAQEALDGVRMGVEAAGAPMGTPERLDASTVRELAVRASCDPKTIVRAFQGKKVKGMSGNRARVVLMDAGLLPRPAVKAGSKLTQGSYATSPIDKDIAECEMRLEVDMETKRFDLPGLTGDLASDTFTFFGK